MKEDLVKFYENIAIEKSDDYDIITSALSVIKNYIIKNKKIIVGGMSIDLSLKMKGHTGLYDENELMDYDIISSTHYQDAYDVAVILAKKGFTGISVINALHPSTMRVRINFKDVIDITYVPENIINLIPILYTPQHYIVVHPHYQYIDQHRALSYPYENPPCETILFRPKKDMIRYDLLYTYYPLRKLYTNYNIFSSKRRTIHINMLDNQCISGFVALNIWINMAKSHGFDPQYKVGECSFDNDILSYISPNDSIEMTLYSDNIKEIYDKLNKEYNFTNIMCYNRFLDKLPRRCVMDSRFELFENNHKITAHPLRSILNRNITANIHVVNLQTIMLYLLVHYIVIMNVKDQKRSLSFYTAYILCADMIQWASKNYKKNKVLKMFLPTADVYGNQNLSDSFIVEKAKFDQKTRSMMSDEIIENTYQQPSNIFDRDLIYKKIPKKYLDFDISKSEIFNYDGLTIGNFLI